MANLWKNGSTRWAVVVLIVGTVAALVLGAHQTVQNHLAAREAFAATVQKLAERVQGRIRTYEYGLRGARGAVIGAGGTAITLSRFREYMATRDLDREFLGARGFGFIRRVAPQYEDGFIARARLEGRPEFTIRDFAEHPGDHYVIQYLEPESQNRPGIGLDIAGEPARRAAAVRAMRTGEATLTAPVTFISNPTQQASNFLVLLPIYTAGTPRDASPQARQAATIGWAFAPLAIDEVLEGLALEFPNLRFRLADVTDKASEQGFFDNTSEVHDHNGLSASVRIDIFGRIWDVRGVATDAFVHGLHQQSAAGLAVSVFACGLVMAALVVFWMRPAEQAQRLQQERESLARGVIDATPSAIIVTDRSGTILLANQRVTTMFGYELEELIGKPLEMLIPEELRSRHRELLQNYDLVPRSMRASVDLAARRRSGQRFPVEVDLRPLVLGEQTLVVAGVADVTEQRAAMQRLQSSEARWKQLANSMPQLVWTCTPEGVCDFLSEQWVQYTRCPAAELLGQNWAEHLHPDDFSRLSGLWAEAVASGSMFHAEFRIRRHDGQYRWFDSRAIPTRDEQGGVLRWIGTNTDVDDRLSAEAGLRDLNATLEQRVAERSAEVERGRRHLEDILNAMPIMVGYWDRELLNRFANHAYRDWFGVDPKALLGTHMRDLLGEELVRLNQRYIDGALRGEPQLLESRIGSRFSQARYVPDRDDNGEVRGFYAFVSDVTELKLATERAEAASAAKSSFLANMSHEIRTPMNAVMNIGYLLEQTGLNDTQRELLGRMKLASRSLLGLINDILDLSKIEAGELVVSTEVLALDELLRDQIRLMQGQAEQKGLDLELELGADVPHYVRGDSLRLAQVLTNLLSNAVKFTASGSVRLRVAPVQDVRREHVIRFEVVDTGIGISEEARQRLFTPFVQADESTTRRFGGTGLGLALVKRLVELMSGQIGVTSIVGEGSCFWFELPLPAASEGTVSSTGARNLQVLLAVESSNTRRRLQGLARGLGWRCETAVSPGRALDLLADRRRGGQGYDVMILDGAAAWQQRTDFSSGLAPFRVGAEALGVILLSSDSATVNAGQSDAFADVTVPTGVDASALLNAVYRALSRRRGKFDAIGAADQPARQGARSLHGMKVLLVDDSEINLDIASSILSSAGAEVHTASNGAEAVACLEAHPGCCDVVLMDVQMPVMDGYEATRHIRNQLAHAELPIIALTAGALVTERERALAAGMDDFVTKPFDAVELIERLARYAPDHDDAAISSGSGSAGTAPAPAEARAVSAALLPGLPDLEGTQFESALQRIGGDPQFLLRMIARLLDEQSTIAKAQTPVPVDALQLAQTAHRIKGAAANLGLSRLAERAAVLEAAARGSGAGDAPAMWAAAWRAVGDELGRLHQQLGGLLPQAPLAAAVATAGPVGGDASAPDAVSLEQWLDWLRANNLRAVDHFEMHADQIAAHFGAERQARMAAAMEDMDFEQVLRIAGEIAGDAGTATEGR